jgi:hypothetical protein
MGTLSKKTLLLERCRIWAVRSELFILTSFPVAFSLISNTWFRLSKNSPLGMVFFTPQEEIIHTAMKKTQPTIRVCAAYLPLENAIKCGNKTVFGAQDAEV